MNYPKEIKCYYNLERRHNSLCNLFCTKDKAVACNYKDTGFARENCEEFKDIPDTAPDIVGLDVSCEDHAGDRGVFKREIGLNMHFTNMVKILLTLSIEK